MKCMCAQTRPRFILSSERVLGEMEFEPMLTPREKSPLPEKFPRGGSNPRHCGQRAQILPTSYSGPRRSLERRDQGPYARQGSTTLLPKLSVTSKVNAGTSCAWVGSRVRFRSSEDVTLLEFTSPVDREYMRRCQKFH